MRNLMRTSMTAAGLAVFLAALALAVGCEDTPVSAVADDKLTVDAAPGSVTLPPGPPADPEDPEFTEVELTATLVTKDGVPKNGVSLDFTSSGASEPYSCSVAEPHPCRSTTTDGSGRAGAYLKVSQLDGAEVNVTARSAAVSGTVKITKTTSAVNRPPVPLIVPTPAGTEQVAGRAVVFDGSSSTDPDTGDGIANYEWWITSTNPDPDKPETIHVGGPGVSGVSFPSDTNSAFTNIQDLTVKLVVTDRNNVTAERTIVYKIVCRNTKPTAVIAGAPTAIQLYGPPSVDPNLPARLDGTLSTDAETPISSYTWTCGNQTQPVSGEPGGGFSQAICYYAVDTVPHTYTATLVVSDYGSGPADPDTHQYPIDPNTGTYLCRLQSVVATIQVVVTPRSGVAR